MKSRTRKLLIDSIIPGILATAFILLFPKIYNSTEQLKPVIDTIGIIDTLVINVQGDVLFEHRKDTNYILAPT